MSSVIPRLASLDRLRGLMMALMALDHTSAVIFGVHRSEYWDRPLPVYEDLPGFITRFSTHICAPGFYLLLGMSAVLFTASRRRAGWSAWRTTRQLQLRGLLLIALQFLVISPLWLLTLTGRFWFPGGFLPAFGPPPLYVGVLASLGMCLVAGSCCLGLNKEALLAAGLLILLGSQLIITGPAQGRSGFGTAARLLLISGEGPGILVNYPLFPWLGVVLLGMALGKTLLASLRLARRRACTSALAGLALFCLLRGLPALGGFGSTHILQDGGFVGFMNLTKYPPSLNFLLFTLSAGLLLWLLFEALPLLPERAAVLQCFGAVPLFFYCLHLGAYTLASLAFPVRLPFPAVYPVWLASLLLFYPACRRYRRFKQHKPLPSFWRAF